MKLATFQAGGASAVGAVVDDVIVDLSAQFPSMLALIDGGDAALELARTAAKRAAVRKKLSEVKLLSPVPEPRHIRDINK